MKFDEKAKAPFSLLHGFVTGIWLPLCILARSAFFFQLCTRTARWGLQYSVSEVTTFAVILLEAALTFFLPPLLLTGLSKRKKYSWWLLEISLLINLLIVLVVQHIRGVPIFWGPYYQMIQLAISLLVLLCYWLRRDYFSVSFRMEATEDMFGIEPSGLSDTLFQDEVTAELVKKPQTLFWRFHAVIRWIWLPAILIVQLWLFSKMLPSWIESTAQSLDDGAYSDIKSGLGACIMLCVCMGESFLVPLLIMIRMFRRRASACKLMIGYHLLFPILIYAYVYDYTGVLRSLSVYILIPVHFLIAVCYWRHRTDFGIKKRTRRADRRYRS